jgi:ankyrin repeat protein
MSAKGNCTGAGCLPWGSLFSRRKKSGNATATRKTSNVTAAAASVAAAAVNEASASRANNNSARELKDRLINTITTSNKNAFNNTIKDILDRDISVNFYDDQGFTPLLRAIDARNSAAVLSLLLCGADKKQASESGITPSRRIDDNTDEDATAYSDGGRGDTPAMNDVRYVFEESESIFKSYREYCNMVSKPHMMKRAISELVVLGEPKRRELPHGFSKVLTQYSKNRNIRNASSFTTYYKFKYVIFLLYTYGCPGLSQTTLIREINSLMKNPEYKYLARDALKYVHAYGTPSGNRNRNNGTRVRSRSRSR